MIAFLIAYLLLKAYQTFRLDYRINIRPVVSWELPLWFRLEWHTNGVVAVTCYGMLGWVHFDWPGFWHIPLHVVPAYLLDIIIELIGMVLV